MVICALCSNEPTDHLSGLWLCNDCQFMLDQYFSKRFDKEWSQYLGSFDFESEPDRCFFCARRISEVEDDGKLSERTEESLCPECEDKYFVIKLVRAIFGEDDHYPNCVFCTAKEPLPVCENHVQEIIVNGVILDSLGYEWLPVPKTYAVKCRVEKRGDEILELHGVEIEEKP